MIAIRRWPLMLGGIACLLWAGSGGVNAQSAHVDVVHSFDAQSPNTLTNKEGAQPYSLVSGSDGNLYGTTLSGGANGNGTIFKLTPEGVFTLLYTFPGDPVFPSTRFVAGSDGNLYGTFLSTFFRITLGGVYTTLYNFPEMIGPPYYLILGNDGNFYGVTSFGGIDTIFRITSSGVPTLLYGGPFGPGGYYYQPTTLTQSSDGNFYGTTGLTTFKLTPAGVFTQLDEYIGFLPNPLVQGRDGNFYGTTVFDEEGGEISSGGPGTIFEMTPQGDLTEFRGISYDPPAGQNPEAGLVLGGDGNFYGTTVSGGLRGFGTVFQLTPDGVVSFLTSFLDIDGAGPAQMLLGPDGHLYGVAAGGGTGTGVIFRVDLNYRTPPDFNGDGHPDLLWQNRRTGEVVITFMDGLTPLSWTKLFTGIDPSYQIVGAPTSSLTSQPDILWQDTATGKVVNTSMNGILATSWSVLFPSFDTHWKIVSTPDFNLDGYPDLLWQNTATGEVVYTLMRGRTPFSWGIIAQGIDPHYRVVAAAHLNSNGFPDKVGNDYPDLIWQNQVTGDVIYTLMNGTTPTAWGKLFTSIDPHYKVVGARDLDGDGFTDILFQNTTTGKVVYALMQFTTVKAWGTLFTGIDPDWQIVGLN
ncbi:MAG TPA: choice-of-anchor tandem repeat GloVer-containing protein [Chthonomonadaceae bacterium]|nr:choice-of-anchor tandem repeat GloVer-containing protein [Chthonomonadaceae bacterium]